MLKYSYPKWCQTVLIESEKEHANNFETIKKAVDSATTKPAKSTAKKAKISDEQKELVKEVAAILSNPKSTVEERESASNRLTMFLAAC